MGSPLGPALANLFMGYHENKWLNSEESSTVLFYERYVGDIFCLFKCETDADRFLTFLNRQPPNIKFTIEEEKNKNFAMFTKSISDCTIFFDAFSLFIILE